MFNLRGIVPAGSLADNYLGAAEDMVAAAQLQGQLNIVNGLTNILVEGFNTSMYVMMGIPTIALTNLANTAAGEAVLPTEFPQIPVIDYSQDAFVFEDPYWHGWSVWCAGTGVTMLLPGGIAKQAGPALKGTSIGRMFTGVSKAQTGTMEAVVSQAKSLVPKSLGKARLARATAPAGQVAEGIAGAPAGVAARGAVTGGIYRVPGREGARFVDIDHTGIPLRQLNVERIKVTNRGINVVEGHLSRFVDDAGRPFANNTVMLRRLRRIANGTLNPTATDLRFYAHELREFVRYRRIGAATGQIPVWRHANAHYATLREYGIPWENHGYYLYTDEAISALFSW